MREHAQPRRPARLRAWPGLILAALLCGPASAEDPRAVHPDLAGVVDLAATRAIVWDAPDGRWALLQGGASASQGDRSVSASSVVVRITGQKLDGRTVYQAELYAEGEVRGPGAGAPARKEGRAVLRSVEGVNVSPTAVWLKEPPAGLDVVARAGFPAEAPAISEPPRHLPREVVEQARASATPADPHVVEAQAVVPVPDAARPPDDPALEPAQGMEAQEPIIDLPPIDAEPAIEVPDLDDFNPSPTPRPRDMAPLPGDLEDPGEVLGPAPLPGDRDDEPAPPLRADEPLPPALDDDEEMGEEGDEDEPRDPLAPPPRFRAPINPGSQRQTWINQRSSRPMSIQKDRSGDTEIWIVRGGIHVVSVTDDNGTLDAEAESAIIWRRKREGDPDSTTGPQGEVIDDAGKPMEIYLEGDVVLRQDENKFAGRADQRTFRAERVYYDFVSDRLMATQAQADVFAPNLISPMKLKAPRIDQFRPVVRGPDGSLVMTDDREIRAEQAISTGSRFPDPSYKIYNRSITLSRQATQATDPNSGKPLRGGGLGSDPQEQVWRYDARTNLFYMGWVPIFYWPRFTGESDDLDPPLRMISFATNNYFGQQVLTDWNGFKLLGIRRPRQIDNWNIDIDYLSARTKTFPALGSEVGWFGNDLINDVRDPFRRDLNANPSITRDYFGYFDIWGLQDKGIDVLGSGPAIITNGPPGAGSRGYQRSGTPSFQDIRGRFNLRHLQRFLPDDEEHRFEDRRLQLEIGYFSDRYFLEEYYKRLFDIGMDHETLLHGQWQKDNWAMSLHAEANLMDFRTDTQWLPKFDYYRLGDTFLGDRVVHSSHSGVNYANTHTDIMVNNRDLFPLRVNSPDLAFIPFDPISNTSGVFRAGRAFTNHELTVPLNISDVVRFNPYVQGQATGWTDQIGGGFFNQQSTGAQGRLWGAAGIHAESTIWKVYSGVESEWLNIHGLNNKVSFFGNYRTAYSSVKLNDLAIQDDLDDDTYEMVRRYFAITMWNNGILPNGFDPRHLMLRRTLSPITGPNDVQSSIDTLNLGIHQRLQTKRGPEGRRRIVDWMTLDASTTYFPNADRDNMGKPWGQTMYNYQWFVGDRTSIISTGWFDYWDLRGGRPQDNYLVGAVNPQGLNVITTGVSLSRPPRGNVFIGYSVIDSAMIRTSALNTSINYWLSPKWYGTFSNSYDFGNQIPLGSMFSFTRVGADYLLSLGLAVDPQRQSYQFAFQVSPRLAPTLRLGSGTGMNQFDSRLAPVQ
ncbi:hypothetical protein [Paludisphaera sp.]|uniref:hypothetical protein n=1 Tax=Paludisphaera sp. TaxID=2017432 RepID=UPI00301CD6F8